MEIKPRADKVVKKKVMTEASYPDIPIVFLLLIPLVLALLTILFYWSSLSYNFQFDDIANITRLFNIRNSTFRALFLNGPRWISYWLNALYYSISRFDPFIYRMGNVSIHTFTGMILFFYLYSALSSLKVRSFFSENALWIATATAAFFLLHPVQTQTVSYVIQGQLEGMAALFSLLTAFLFLKACQSSSFMLKNIFGVAASLTAFIACGTKEIAIVIPFLTLLTDWFFIAQGNWQELKKRLLWHGVLAGIVWGMYAYFLKPSFFAKAFGLQMEARNNIGNVLTQAPQDKILPFPFFISQFKVVLHYIAIFLWPFSMSVEYDWKLVEGFFAPDCLLPFLGLMIIASTLIWHLRKNTTSVIGFSCLWFFIALAPRSSIIPSSELLTDYKTYLASIGLLLCLAILFIWGVKKILPFFSFLIHHSHYKTYPIFILLIIVPMGYATYRRNTVWRTGEEFWLDVIHHAPGKARAYNNYAVALSERGDHSAAIPYYQQAIAMDKNYPDPLNNIAVSYAVMEDLDRAIGALKQAIAIQPHYPEAYNNLASFLIKKNELDPAEKLLMTAIQLRPYYGKAYFNLGKIYLMKNEAEQALQYFKKACLEGDLDNEAGFKVYGEVSLRLQKYDEALIAYKKLTEIIPTSEYYFALANVYFLANKYTESIEVYTKLTRTSPQDMRAWYNLGEAYVKIENYGMALTCFQKAKTLANAPVMTPLRCAFCLDALGRRNEAVEVLQHTLALNVLSEPLKRTVETMVMQMQRSMVAVS